MFWLCARNAAWVPSLVAQPVPSRIAPYSPTNVLPVLGMIALVSECTPARRQNVVSGWRLTMPDIDARPDVHGAGWTRNRRLRAIRRWGWGRRWWRWRPSSRWMAQCFGAPTAGSPNTLLVQAVPLTTSGRRTSRSRRSALVSCPQTRRNRLPTRRRSSHWCGRGDASRVAQDFDRANGGIAEHAVGAGGTVGQRPVGVQPFAP